MILIGFPIIIVILDKTQNPCLRQPVGRHLSARNNKEFKLKRGFPWISVDFREFPQFPGFGKGFREFLDSLSDSQTKSQEMLQILENPQFSMKSMKIWWFSPEILEIWIIIINYYY